MISEIFQWLNQGQVRLLQAGLGKCKQVYNRANEIRTSNRLVNLFGRSRFRGPGIMIPSSELLPLPLESFFIFVYADVRRQPESGGEVSTYTSAIISFIVSLRFEASALRAFFPNAILSFALVYSAYSGTSKQKRCHREVILPTVVAFPYFIFFAHQAAFRMRALGNVGAFRNGQRNILLFCGTDTQAFSLLLCSSNPRLRRDRSLSGFCDYMNIKIKDVTQKWLA